MLSVALLSDVMLSDVLSVAMLGVANAECYGTMVRLGYVFEYILMF
jgi:hypothetical protein